MCKPPFNNNGRRFAPPLMLSATQSTLMDDRKLFLATLHDLRRLLRLGDDYAMLRASAMLRQLLLDGGSSLVHKVNARHRHRIRFPVCGTAHAERILSMRPKYFSRLGGIHASGPHGATMEDLTLDQFLATQVLQLLDHAVTIKDLISHAANIAGGVHHGNASTDKEEELSRWATLENGATLTFNAAQMRSVIEIVLDALEELEQSVLNNEPT